MVCPGCGKNVGDHEKFCRYCGYTLQEEKKKKFCGQCGNELSESDVFCGKCGTPCKAENGNSVGSHIVEKGYISEMLNEDDLEKTISVEEIQERWQKPGMDYRNKVEIPETEEHDQSTYDEYEDRMERSERKGKKRGWLIALIAILLILSAGAGVTVVMLFSSEDNIVKQVLHFNQDNADVNEVDAKNIKEHNDETSSGKTNTEQETKGQYTAKEETSTEETSTEETEELPSSEVLLTMNFVDSDVKNFPVTPEEFTEVESPDGVYTLKYPMNFFKTGYYNSETKSYQFITADGQISLEIKAEEAAIKNDPKNCANSRLEQYKPMFMVTEDSPYIYSSKAVAESGFSRSIIAGVLKDDATSGKYIVTACNSSTTYTMTINYYALDTSGAGVSYTPTGYLLDCLYRGWSISGSTYQLRTYEQYMNDEMGNKK